jgi:hypothetical protein
MSTTTEQDSKYPFLKVRKDKDSILMGINPTNKHQHEMIKAVKTLNTVQHAMKGMLFSLNSSSIEPFQIDMKTAITNFSSLVTNQFMIQVYAFEYDAHNKSLKVNNYFINHPSEEKNYTIYNIFDEILSFSYNSIKSWFDNRDKFTTEGFKKDLLSQFQQKSTDPKSMGILINPLKFFQEYKSGVPVSEEMLEAISKELGKRLVEMNLAKEIPDHGLILLKPAEILEHYEAASEFLNEKIIPSANSEPVQRSRLDKVSLEEKIYFSLEKYPIKTAKYTAMKAKEIKQYKSMNPKTSTYPGSLCVETLIRLEDISEDKYQLQWKEDCNKIKMDFKKNIIVASNKWSKLINFVSHAEAIEFHPELWKELIIDKDLLYTQWQMPKGTVHIFTGKEPGFFKVIIPGMMGLSASDMWKASAIKNHMEKNQKQLRGLLADSSFSIIYQDLERRIYLSYLPWYFKIFLYFPFFFFLEAVLVNAKKQIASEQETFGKKNEGINAKLITEKQSLFSNKVLSLKEDFIFESIVQTLDNYYLGLKKVPSVNDVKQYFEDYDSFSNIVNSRKFRIIPMMIKNVEEDVLLYPDDEDWRQKKSQISKTLDNIVHEKNPHINNQNLDKAKIEKAQKLLTLIENNSLPKVKAI